MMGVTLNRHKERRNKGYGTFCEIVDQIAIFEMISKIYVESTNVKICSSVLVNDCPIRFALEYTSM